MAIENTVVAKVIGGLAAIGGTSGGGYYAYSYIAEHLKNDYVFLVTQVTAVTDQSDANLYNTDKSKNYQCIFGEGENNKYDCDILKKIEFDSKNWINFSSINGNEETKKDLTKDAIKANTYFALKIDKKIASKLKIDGAETITISPIVQQAGVTTAKNFGQVKVIAGKNGNQALGSFNNFLARADEIKEQTLTSPTTKCKFGSDTPDTNLKACSLKTFSNTQTDIKDKKDYSGLTYNHDATGTTTITDKNYYVVTFTETNDKFSKKDFQNKDLIYVEQAASGATDKKIVKFTPFYPITIHTESGNTAKKVIIIS